MLVVETIAKIRRAYFVQGKAIKAICRELKISRKVVRKVLRSNETAFEYERSVQPLPAPTRPFPGESHQGGGAVTEERPPLHDHGKAGSCSKGSATRTPRGAKCRTFRVSTVKP